MNPFAKRFKRRIKESLKDDNLRENLNNALSTTLDKRRKAVESIPNWEELRTRAHRVKTHSIENLDRYLKRFIRSARIRNIKIVTAEDSREANNYIKELAVERNAGSIVKSKTMTAEEIGLNQHLTKAGFDVLETDLGEFIAQLAGVSPSHIVAPIIHMSIEEVADIYERCLDLECGGEARDLARKTRSFFRERFREADIGITGVNFGLAEEGSLAVVENEGNVGMTATLPEIHIAIMGIEKIIPSADYLPLFMKLLPASATGQRISNYLNIIGGSGNGDSREIHLILLDNGRTDILKDKQLRQILYCIRCGACMNVCPVYGRIGGHTYGTVYPGPMGAVLSPLLDDSPKKSELAFASTLCGRCSESCPVKIPLDKLLLRIRSDYVEEEYTSVIERLAVGMWLYANRELKNYRLAGRWLRKFQQLLPGETLPVPGWSSDRDFPEASNSSFHQMWENKNG